MPLPISPVAWLRAEQKMALESLLATRLESAHDSWPLWLELGALYVNGARVGAAQDLQAEDVVKVHLAPRRFPSIPRIRDHFLFECADFLVVNKPSGVPVHATCDNAQENLVRFLEKEVGRVYLVHRLDIATCGLMVIAKTPEGRDWLHRQVAERSVHKGYRALVTGEILPGSYRHWMEPSDRAPKILRDSPAPLHKVCELEVLSCRKGTKYLFEVEMVLGTGRQHQIRAQLSHLGAPIVGDKLYGGKEVAEVGLPPVEAIALQCRDLKFKDLSGRLLSFSLDFAWSSR